MSIGESKSRQIAGSVPNQRFDWSRDTACRVPTHLACSGSTTYDPWEEKMGTGFALTMSVSQSNRRSSADPFVRALDECAQELDPPDVYGGVRCGDEEPMSHA